jgi:hypothetical protein
MASRRDEQKNYASEARAIDRTIEETKDNAKKVIQEVKRELPENTSMFHDFQEQNMNDAREMTNTFLDSQKQVVKSIQAALSHTNNPMLGMMFGPYQAAYIQTWADNYLKTAAAIADTTAVAVRTQSDLVMEAFASTRSFMNYARANTKAMAKMNEDNAKTFERLSTDFAGSVQTTA